MLNLFTRGTGWLRDALRLQEPEGVVHLETGAAIATVDMLEAGIRDDEAYWFGEDNTQPGTGTTLDWSLFSDGTIAASSAASLATAFSREFAALVMVSLVNQGAGAQNTNSYQWLYKGYSVPTNVRLSYNVAMAGNGALSQASLLGSPRVWYIPPRCALQVSSNSTLGQDITFQYQGVRLPARSLKHWL